MWSTHYNDISVRCVECIKDKQGCSFSTGKWFVANFPHLQPSEEGLARRLKEAQNKRRSTANANAMAKSISEGSGVGGPATGTRSRGERSVTRDSPAEIPPTAAPLVELKQSPGPSLTICPPFSRLERVPLEDLNRYDQILRRPSRTPELIGSAIAELNAARRREADSISMLAKFVEDRAKIIGLLLIKMQLEAARLEDPDGRRVRDPGISRTHTQQRARSEPYSNQEQQKGGNSDEVGEN